MMLREELRRRLLADRGVYVTEACDKCGQLLGPVRYTRKGESGVWCSRECRDGKEAHTPGTCKFCKAELPAGKRKGSGFCDDTCRQAARRANRDKRRSLAGKLSVTNPFIGAGFEAPKQPL